MDHFMFFFFFFNDTATTEIYTFPYTTLFRSRPAPQCPAILPLRLRAHPSASNVWRSRARDRKSTRLNSSHGYISYAVFCLKKKKTHDKLTRTSPAPSRTRRASFT